MPQPHIVCTYLEWLFSRVVALVGLEVPELREGLAAARPLAHVRTVPCVRALVYPQVGELREHLAAAWLATRVLFGRRVRAWFRRQYGIEGVHCIRWLGGGRFCSQQQ